MEQKSEQINLEYMVEFEDGLRPKVCVYGIDPAGRVYGAEARVGVSVGAGYHVSRPREEDFKNRQILAQVDMNSCMDISLISSLTSLILRDLSKSKNWEQKMHEEAREYGMNIIKVQNPSDINVAIDRHAQLYSEQFRELAERFTNLFQGFIGEHPGFGQY